MHHELQDYTLRRIRMQKVKCMQNSDSVSQASKYDHNVKPLMARTKDIESLPKPPFWKLEIGLATDPLLNRMRLKLEAEIP